MRYLPHTLIFYSHKIWTKLFWYSVSHGLYFQTQKNWDLLNNKQMENHHFQSILSSVPQKHGDTSGSKSTTEPETLKINCCYDLNISCSVFKCWGMFFFLLHWPWHFKLWLFAFTSNHLISILSLLSLTSLPIHEQIQVQNEALIGGLVLFSEIQDNSIRFQNEIAKKISQWFFVYIVTILNHQIYYLILFW